MPFTFAHPAFAILFKNKWKSYISFTGLIIGCMLPDIEYFIRMQIKSVWSHTAFGVFWFDLPLGIVLCFVFHLGVKQVLYKNIPNYMQSKLEPFLHLDWTVYFTKKWMVVILSILIGIYSHIIWDSFTHEDGYFVMQIPLLQNSVEVFHFKIPLYKILQHGSTILGFLFIGIFWNSLPKNVINQSTMSWKYWLMIGVLVSSILLLRFYNVFNELLIGNVIVSTISAIILSIIIVSVLYRITSKNSNR